MARIKRGNVARSHRNKILGLAKGFKGAHSKLFRVANQQIMKALCYAYVSRKLKKRTFRTIWISRVNAAARLQQLSYNKLIYSLKKLQIILNRKMLSQLILLDPSTFIFLIKDFKLI
jgi:large subunit ribosomal protein L20